MIGQDKPCRLEPVPTQHELFLLATTLDMTLQRYLQSRPHRLGDSIMESRVNADVLRRALLGRKYATALAAIGNINVWIWQTRKPDDRQPEREDLVHAIRSIRSAVVQIQHSGVGPPPVDMTIEPERSSRRARWAADLAVRMLPPVDRQRYREEWGAEIMDIARRDQAAYAFRLLSRAWSLRRSLKGTPSSAPRSVLIFVSVVVPGADALAAVCGLDWQATVLGVGWTVGLMWVVTSKERTHNLVTLIREARTSKSPTQK